MPAASCMDHAALFTNFGTRPWSSTNSILRDYGRITFNLQCTNIVITNITNIIIICEYIINYT